MPNENGTGIPPNPDADGGAGNPPPKVDTNMVSISKAEFEELQKAKESNPHLFARAKKAEEDRKAALEAAGKVPDVFDAVAENLSVMRGLSDPEVAALTTEAKNLGVNPIGFIKSGAGQAFLKTIRADKKVADTSLPPSGRTAPMFNGKSATDIIRDPGASAIDKQGAFEAARDAILRKNRSSQNV